MQISELRDRVSRELLAFAWNEWAQMGVLSEARSESPWAADPEAHLLFTLQIARDDPRLFDETLDWFSTNAALVSAQRLRNMAAEDEDKRLAEAAIAWVAKHRGRFRGFSAKPLPMPEAPQPLFYGMHKTTDDDESFSAFGFRRSPSQPSKKSRRPDLRRPINFGFRLRNVFGLGVRAEVMRFLLTASRHAPPGRRPRFSTPAIADEAGFAKRNVHDALVALAEAGSIELSVIGREHFYAVDVAAWSAALGVEDSPIYRDWTHILLGLRELHRWLAEAESADFTPYMLASEARLKMGEIQSSFTHAGMPLREARPAEGADYWEVFVDLVEQMLKQYRSELPF